MRDALSMLFEWQVNCNVQCEHHHGLLSQMGLGPETLSTQPGGTLMKIRSGLFALGFLIASGAISLRLWVSRPALAQNSLTLTLDTIVTGLSLPVFVTHAGDGSDSLYIVEQAGRIRIFQNDSLLATPFLD